MKRRTAPLAAIALAAWCLAFSAAAQPMGKTKEYRSLNSDLYKISIQKDGRLDVTLATDTPVITDVFPMIWFDGEDEPERMQIRGAWTERYLVEDKLGQGQGIHHQYKGCLWSLRAYPTRPYFAVQLGYTNETKKTVRVKALLPWCVGAPAKGMLQLGPGSETSTVLSGITIGKPVLSTASGQAEDAIAILNNNTGQSFIAGFLAQDHGLGLLDVGTPIVEDKKTQSGLGRFRAMTIYDEPIELAPGDTLHSEVLYLAISEADPVVGLQRYARAVQVVNSLAGPGHDAPMHAWIVDATPPNSAADIVEKLRRIKQSVPLYAINHVALMANLADNPDALDPRIVSAMRDEGYSPILFYPRHIARIEPGALKQEATALRHRFGPVSVSGLSVSNAANLADKAAVQAFREGLGPDARIFGNNPSLAAATMFDGVTSAAWDKLFLSPQPARHAVNFYTGNPHDTFQAARLVAAVLTGCSIHVGLDLADDPAIATLLARVLPSPKAVARPIDLFASAVPRAFQLHTKTADGDVYVTALMNWEGVEPYSLSLPLARIGLTPGAFYTVYDYGQNRYLGTAADVLNITVPARGYSALVFRPVLSRPMLAATGTNLGQDWPGLRTAEWSPQARTFTVTPAENAALLPAPESPARYTLAVPAPYKITRVGSMSSETPQVESSGTWATIAFTSRTAAQQGFVAEFSTEP